MTTDLAVDGGLLLLMLLGMRRGFFKEALGVLGVAGGIACALWYAEPLGPRLAGALEVGAGTGFVLACAALFAGGFLAVQIPGRMLRARLTAPTGGGGRVARAARGTVASLVGAVDAGLGGALGLAKGVLLVAVLLYAAEDLGFEAARARLAPTVASRVYREHVAPALEAIPEVRVARSLGRLRHAATVLSEHPERLDRLTRHPALAGVAGDPRIRALAADPRLRTAALEGHLEAVLADGRVLDLLLDRGLVGRLAQVDAGAVLADVRRETPPLWLFPLPGVTPRTAPPAIVAERAADAAREGGGPDGRYRRGTIVAGRVAAVTPEGAVVLVGEPALEPGSAPVYGLIRPPDLSWTRPGAAPAEVLAAGAAVRCMVLAAAPGTRHVALGLKQARSDPWERMIPSIYRPGMRAAGPIVRQDQRGAWVLLDGFVEALLPAGELARLPEAPAIGVRVLVAIERIDVGQRTIVLRLRGLDG